MKKNFASRFRNWDAYAKTLDDFTIKTSAGALRKYYENILYSSLFTNTLNI